MPARLPLALSLIICDDVVVDRTTGKCTLFGTFSNIASIAFPTVMPELTVFCELTDGSGETNIELKFVRTTAEALEGDPIYSMTTVVPFTDPLAIGRLILKTRALVFPQPGEYRFIVESDGRQIAERRIVALLQPSAQERADP